MKTNLANQIPGALLTASLFTTMSVEAQTGAFQFQSAPERTALLELYTSEGCSSCPPAEKWVSGLQNSPRLWKDFAPVAFHVDYWNYLGWNDNWSDAAYTERQRNYSRVWRSENIYTPELVLNGKEWRNWFSGKNGPGSDGAKVGVLTVSSMDGKVWEANFVPATESGARYEIHAALLSGGLISNVKAGENSGRQLLHDFAVVNLRQSTMSSSNGLAHATFMFGTPRAATGKTSAITAWVTRAGELAPEQSTGGWLIAPGKISM